MAKKSYQNLTSWGMKLRAKNRDKSELIIKGQNSSGTEVEVKVLVDNYEFPVLVEEMTKVAKEAVLSAERDLQRIREAVK